MRDPLAFVKEHGVVLASARGPVPSLAELTVVSGSPDVRCFKLVDGEVTFVARAAKKLTAEDARAALGSIGGKTR